MASQDERLVGRLYDGPGDGRLYSPFSLTVNPIDRLMLVNFEDDEVYAGFEPQVVDDEVLGRGMLVLGYRQDGKVDVYYEAGLALDPDDYQVGSGLGAWEETVFEEARFDISVTGVDLDMVFFDVMGRTVALHIHERDGKVRKPLALLAPLGSGIRSPLFMPLFYMFGFCFVRRRRSEVRILVGGEKRKASLIPIPIGGALVYFLRYASQPLIVKWNEAHDGPMEALQPLAAGRFEHGGVVYDLVEVAGHYEIASMAVGNQTHEVRTVFDPPVPDILGLADGVTVEGTVSVQSDPAAGLVTGGYRVTRHGERAAVTVYPEGGWQPNERRPSVRALYAIVKSFQDWPATYRWTASLILAPDDGPRMTSRWKRLT